MWLLAGVFLTPLVVWMATVALDARDGYHHRPHTYAAPLLLWPYLAVQLWAIVTAFLDEFVLGQPARYVTS